MAMPATISQIHPAQAQVFTEVFPILTEHLPSLAAYRIAVNAESADRAEMERKLGGKLVYRLRTLLDGTWVWAGSRVLTDSPTEPAILDAALQSARQHTAALRKGVRGLEYLAGWQPTPELLAEFVVRGYIEWLTPQIQEALTTTTVAVRNAHVTRECRARAWNVAGHPSISLSVVSRLIYDQEVQEYAAALPKVTDIAGLMVTDRSTTMQGEIIKVVGTLEEHRERLLAMQPRPATAQILRESPDSHLILRVLSGANEYDYPAGALQLLVRMDDAQRYDVNAQQVEKALHLKPALRAHVVKVVSNVIKESGLIGSAYSVQNSPALFGVSEPPMQITFGGGKTRRYQHDKLATDFLSAGAAQVRTSTEGTRTLRVVVINTLDDLVDDFVEAMRRQFTRDHNVTFEVVRERKMRVSSQANLESGVRLLAKETADVMLVFLPDNASDEDEGVDALFTKTQTIGRGLPSMVVHRSTLEKPDAMTHVIMGLLARAGDTPYLLEQPLTFADRVIGIALTVQSKRGSDTYTAITRIYRSDGLLLGAVIGETTVGEGQPVPDAFFETLFPRKWLARKRIILHTDGTLPREFLRALGGWEDELGATFHPVEILQRGVPRLYALQKSGIESPEWGSTFRLNDQEAFVLTSIAPRDATPQPLYVRCEAPLSIEQAVQSALAFTLLHYGALQRPKLPVTLHHGELLEAAVQRGVLPTAREADAPFWL